MKRLLRLEFLKLFWIQNSILFLAYIFISTTMDLLTYLVTLESTNQPLNTGNALNFYNILTDNFPTLGKYLLIFMIINIGQESGNKSLAKNLMDGLTRIEYLSSKLILLILLIFIVLVFEIVKVSVIAIGFSIDLAQLFSYFSIKDLADYFIILLFSGASGIFIGVLFGKVVFGLVFYFILNFILNILNLFVYRYQLISEETLFFLPQVVFMKLISTASLNLLNIVSLIGLFSIFIWGSLLIIRRKAL